MLKLGEKNISKLYSGNKKISKAYLGDKLVFESSKPIFIDYIESTGTQWLDTGLYLDSYRIVIEAQGTEAPKSNYNILCSHLRDYAGCALFAYNEFWGLKSDSLTSVSIFGRTKLDATFDIVGGFSHSVLTINGVTTEYQRTSTPPYPRHNIQIFSSNASTHVYKEFIGKVFGFEIYDLDGNLLMNAKPCLHPKTFEACMYDTVSKKYLYNQGSGEFIPAPRFIEYIKSTGTQWIDTGILPSYDYTIKVKYAYTAFKSSYNCIFGARTQALSEGNQIYWVGCNNNSKELMMRMGKVASTYIINRNEVYELIINPNEATINGTSLGDAMYDGEIGFSKNIRLFSINDDVTSSATASFVASAELYYFQVYDKVMKLIQDLRPCLDPKGVVCMYDMVTGQYFYNAGTGTFGYTEE